MPGKPPAPPVPDLTPHLAIAPGTVVLTPVAVKLLARMVLARARRFVADAEAIRGTVAGEGGDQR
jgi:hypothetical protein